MSEVLQGSSVSRTARIRRLAQMAMPAMASAHAIRVSADGDESVDVIVSRVESITTVDQAPFDDLRLQCATRPAGTGPILSRVAIRHDAASFGAIEILGPPGETDNFLTSTQHDVAQVLADLIGTVLAEGRVQNLLTVQYEQGRGLADRLSHLIAEQRELLEQLANVEERERMLLAEDIHDEPLQLIVAATMRLDAMASESQAHSAEIEQLIGLLEDAVEKLRTLIVALTTPRFDDGLGVALKGIADGVFVVDKSVRVVFTGADHVSLTPSRKSNVCRIIREALVNARKHAKATLISVDLREESGMVAVTLRDNGVGSADLSPRPGHLGMATMIGRAAAEGGELATTSIPGVGTTVILRVPVDRPPPVQGDRPEATESELTQYTVAQ